MSPLYIHKSNTTWIEFSKPSSYSVIIPQCRILNMSIRVCLCGPRRTTPSSSSLCPPPPRSRASYPTTWPTWSCGCGPTAAYRAASPARGNTSSTIRRHSEWESVCFAGTFPVVEIIQTHFFSSSHAVCSNAQQCPTTINVNATYWVDVFLNVFFFLNCVKRGRVEMFVCNGAYWWNVLRHTRLVIFLQI